MERNHTARETSASTPVTLVVEAVADREGVAPMELQPPLYDAVDPEALNALVSSADGDTDTGTVRVSFEYNGYDITVGSDGDVSVGEPGTQQSMQSEADIGR
ncbi:HalOD1 output domain-containing protein [Natrinema versiforme]|uniref:Halobacterial output domain-containing protein n=1 Tax=Natrinema versiforme TaxID=88724 RepID=A0A4P8WIX7_9EURY|nr:HalOD1 output domain-containing protein [Natrinema versiforme]QCS43032.1 hypothetical protein FEJ81_11940 [Natrinema versiforme]